MQGTNHAGNCRQKQCNHRQNGEKEREKSFSIAQSNTPNEKQDRQRRCTGNRSLGNQGKHLRKRSLKLLSNLTAVVARNDNYLSATRARPFTRRTGIILRNNILAYASTEEFRQDRSVQFLANKQDSGRQRHQHANDSKHRNNQRQQGKHSRCAAANHTRQIRIAHAVKVLDCRRKTCIFLKLLGNIERRLLLFLGARRAGTDFLRQVRNMFFHIRHMLAFHSSALQRHIWIEVYAICPRRPKTPV